MNLEELKAAISQCQAYGFYPMFIIGTHDLPKGTTGIAYNADDLEKLLRSIPRTINNTDERSTLLGAPPLFHGLTVLQLPKERRHQ